MQVSQEVQFQMRRINWHPSVVLWSGNSNVENALGSWFEASRQNPGLYVSDYTSLFLCAMRKTAAMVAPYGLFLDSTPSNGILAGAKINIASVPYIKRWVPYAISNKSTYSVARLVSQSVLLKFSINLGKNVGLQEGWSPCPGYVAGMQTQLVL